MGWTRCTERSGARSVFQHRTTAWRHRNPNNSHSGYNGVTTPNDVSSISYVQLLRDNRSFRNLWLSQAISNGGDWFSTIAVLALVLELTDSGLALSVTMLAQTLPSFLMAPVAGVVADRFDRKQVMLASDILRGVIAFGFLLVDEPGEVWLVFLCMALLSGLSPFYEATRNASLPSIVRRPEELLAANALSSATWGLMLTIGSAIGGGVATIFGRDTAFVLNGLSFFISGMFVLRIIMPKSAGAGQPVRFFSDFVSGLGYIKRDRSTRVFLPVKATWAIGSGAAVMLYALFGGQVFDRGDLGIAILFTARGAGTLIGTIGMKLVTTPNLQTLRRGIYLGLSSYGLFFMVFSFAPSFWIAAISLMLSTCGSMVMWVFSSLGLQLVVKESYRGRAFAADGGLFTLATAMSTLSGGLLLDILDPRTVAFGAGALGIAAASVWFLFARTIPLHHSQTD